MAPPAAHSCPTCHTILLVGRAQLLVPATCPGCGGALWWRTEFGAYRLRAMLGRGAMSVVFRAFDTRREREVALKIIRPPYAAQTEDFVAFEEAARRLVALEHPHCARIFAAGIDDGLAYLAMEDLPHGSLATRLATVGRLGEIETLALAVQTAAALGAAHAAGLPHRDFTPRRVRFAADGSVRVTGFAEHIFLDAASAEVGIVRGRLCSAAPERLRGRREDVRSDLFAFGATLFETFTGTPLHEGEPHGEVIRDLHDTGPVRIEGRGHSLHAMTLAALGSLLRIDPEERPQSWPEASAALLRAQAATAPPEPPVVGAPPPAKGRWVTLVVLALVVIAAGILGWSHWRQAAP